MIGKIIRYMRKTKGYKQSELGEKCNLALTTISGYETGYSQPSFDIIEMIANECGFEIQFVEKSTNKVITSKNIEREEI